MSIRTALRFYEKKGVLVPHRDENGYRLYTMDDVARIQIVLSVPNGMGFSIGMILKLLGQDGKSGGFIFSAV